MRNRMVLCGLLLMSPIGLAAQRRAEPVFRAWDDTVAVDPGGARPANGGMMALAGAGGLVAGALAGGFVGVGIDGDSGLDAAEGAVIGGIIGTSLLVPTAVHLANGGRGNLGRSMFVSILTGGAMLGLGVAAESGEIVIAAPFVQLVTSLLIEGDTMR
jgi:hypothetical protein